MKRTRVFVRALCLLMVLVWSSAGMAAESLPTDSIRHDQSEWPKLELKWLSNPSTVALSATTDRDVSVAGPVIDEANDLRRFGLGYSLNALVPFAYHPSGNISTAIDVRLNWLIRGEQSVNYEKYIGKMVSGQPITRDDLPPGKDIVRAYSGSFKLVIGKFEVARDSTAWVLQNTLAGLEVEQRIPYTMKLGTLINRSRLPVGVTPAVVKVGGQLVYDAQKLDSNTTRLSLDARWQLPMLNLLYLVPQVSVKWQDKMKVKSYFQGDIRYVIGSKVLSFIPSTGGIFPFVRYVTGRQAPDYRVVNSWQVGLGGSI